LIGRGHLLRRGVEVEDALVEILNRLHHRHLPVEPGLIDDRHRLAEFEHDRLLVLVHDKHREIGDGGSSTEDHHEDGKERPQHQLLPPLFLAPGTWSSGRRGSTAGPPLLSRIILSVPPSTRSMVSRYMRLRVTSGAFLYSS